MQVRLSLATILTSAVQHCPTPLACTLDLTVLSRNDNSLPSQSNQSDSVNLDWVLRTTSIINNLLVPAPPKCVFVLIFCSAAPNTQLSTWPFLTLRLSSKRLSSQLTPSHFLFDPSFHLPAKHPKHAPRIHHAHCSTWNIHRDIFLRRYARSSPSTPKERKRALSIVAP